MEKNVLTQNTEVVLRNRYCSDCGYECFIGGKDFYMVQHEIWDKYGSGKGLLCIGCLEKRMGRKLIKEDFILCSVNEIFNYYTRALMNPNPQPPVLPEVGKKYSAFLHGNISERKRQDVLITEVIPFDKIDKKSLRAFRRELTSMFALIFDAKTEFFIKGVLKRRRLKDEHLCFVNTFKHEAGWLSIGNGLYRLDVDNSLTASIPEKEAIFRSQMSKNNLAAHI